MSNQIYQFNRGLLEGYYVIKSTGEHVKSGENSFGLRAYHGFFNENTHRPKPADLRLSHTARDWDFWEETDPGYFIEDPQALVINYRPASYIARCQPRHSPDLNYDYELDLPLRLAIKDMTVNLAQDFAEYRQTCGMFADMASNLAGAFRNLRKNVGYGTFVRWLKDPRTRVQKSIANQWLQYQYGMKPLMSDLHELVTGSLASLGPDRYALRTVNVRKVYTYEWQDTLGYPDVPRMQTVQTEFHSYRMRSRARFRVRPGDLSWLSSYGFTNPAELAWELIPYSFVADWLFNVGDLLSGLDALVGVELAAVQPSCFVSKRCSTTWGQTYLYTNAHRGSQRTDLSYGRIRYEPSKSLKSVLNGLALLTQLRR